MPAIACQPQLQVNLKIKKRKVIILIKMFPIAFMVGGGQLAAHLTKERQCQEFAEKECLLKGKGMNFGKLGVI